MDQLEGIWRSLPEGRLKQKVDLIRCLWLGLDRHLRRKDVATVHGASARSLNRWVHEFNTWGLPGILAAPDRAGRKPKVSRSDFDERILPEAEHLAKLQGAVTVKALFRAAQTVGFNCSHSTFRRCLGALRDKYRRRRIEPTIEELLFYQRSGKWPQRLKAFGRRQAKKEQAFWKRYRESSHDKPPSV